jgi:hypothetical protein
MRRSGLQNLAYRMTQQRRGKSVAHKLLAESRERAKPDVAVRPASLMWIDEMSDMWDNCDDLYDMQDKDDVIASALAEIFPCKA